MKVRQLITHSFSWILLKNHSELQIHFFALLKRKAKFWEDALFKLLHFRFCFSARRKGELHLLFPSFFPGVRGRPDSICTKTQLFCEQTGFITIKWGKVKEGRKKFLIGILRFSIVIFLLYTELLYSFCHSKLATKTLWKTIDSCYKTY